MSLFLCCTGLGTMVVVRVSDTYFLAVCNCGFINTVYSPLLNGKSRDHKQTHTWYLPQGNFPSEIETRSLSFSTLLVWRSHICITSLTALRFFD
ncbi:hypothetical protein N7465_006783 [Penicillium sp. CMV-2018d]|nr:hypothetical protein N7465_006783 [Penicillium sp. CMV-2018d]